MLSFLIGVVVGLVGGFAFELTLHGQYLVLLLEIRELMEQRDRSAAERAHKPD